MYPDLIIKQWIEVHDQSGESHEVSKLIRFKKSMLRSDVCDYFHAYIVIKVTITV